MDEDEIKNTKDIDDALKDVFKSSKDANGAISDVFRFNNSQKIRQKTWPIKWEILIKILIKRWKD